MTKFKNGKTTHIVEFCGLSMLSYIDDSLAHQVPIADTDIY